MGKSLSTDFRNICFQECKLKIRNSYLSRRKGTGGKLGEVRDLHGWALWVALRGIRLIRLMKEFCGKVLM